MDWCFSGSTENDVQLELVREEAAEQERGILPVHNVSLSAFVLAGLDLEEQQCVFPNTSTMTALTVIQASHQGGGCGMQE
jgi:hypothetical protein